MASYVDYGPGDLDTTISYRQGGYQTRPAPEVGAVLMGAMRSLLE